MSPPVLTGLETLKADGFAPLKNRRVGILTNPTAVDGRYRHLLDLLADAGVRVLRVFSPEHGLFSVAQDMIAVGAEPHSVEVVSLYGNSLDSLRPRVEHLSDLEILVFDIEDIGSRYYTYVWTLAMMIETAARTGTRVLVLDRPNPITAARVEGGGLEPRLHSFVGYWELPHRHGLTAGEIAAAYARTVDHADVQIVRMQNYRRGLWHDQTGAPWVFPSPNMPNPETALVYPGQCWIEGTNLSEGRGTTMPFLLCGAPFIDEYRLARALEAEQIPGVVFRPLQFQPTFHKFAGQRCGGAQIHVLDRDVYLPVRTTIAILRHVRALWPRDFAWRTETYEFRDDVPAIDLLTGNTRVRELIDAGASVSEIAAFVDSTGDRARRNRADALLYPE